MKKRVVLYAIITNSCLKASSYMPDISGREIKAQWEYYTILLDF